MAEAASLRAQSILYKVSAFYEMRLVVSEGSQTSILTNFFITGVMRFLQTEWHRHERDRNAWQIERAEMKSRIGKLEGDGRTNKRLRESMDKHIRLLEHALKKEREKVKTLQSGSQTEEKKEEGQVGNQNTRPIAKGKRSSAVLNYV